MTGGSQSQVDPRPTITTEDLDRLGELAHDYFREKNVAREMALSRSRDALRLAANSVRAIHRHDYELARSLTGSSRQLLDEAMAALRDHDDVLYAGFLQDAQKEYVEAMLTLALVSDDALPGPEQLAVGWPAYLNGLGEAASELRRYILDLMRAGPSERAEPLLQKMNEVYELLVTFDYPDSMTGGLRRTTDLVRGVLERTRGDLTLAAQNWRLEQAMADYRQGMPASHEIAD